MFQETELFIFRKTKTPKKLFMFQEVTYGARKVKENQL